MDAAAPGGTPPRRIDDWIKKLEENILPLCARRGLKRGDSRIFLRGIARLIRAHFIRQVKSSRSHTAAFMVIRNIHSSFTHSDEIFGYPGPTRSFCAFHSPQVSCPSHRKAYEISRQALSRSPR
jgi:hypothetical protein